MILSIHVDRIERAANPLADRGFVSIVASRVQMAITGLDRLFHHPGGDISLDLPKPQSNRRQLTATSKF